MKSLTALSTRIQGIASIRSFLFLTLIMFGLGYAMLSSASPSEELMALANGLNVPDTQFWRSADALYSQLADYGEYGIHLYLTRVSPVDLFIPIAQALFLSIPITLVFQRAFDTNSVWQLLNTIPFAAMVGDYLENASVATIMLVYRMVLGQMCFLGFLTHSHTHTHTHTLSLSLSFSFSLLRFHLTHHTICCEKEG